jgi:pantetheine-phosphate adenylyltransferase
MMNKETISTRLKQLSFDPLILERYEESHRCYHNIDHICYVLDKLSPHSKNDTLFLAAVFHDIVYDPKSQTNEADSAELFLKEAASAKLDSNTKQEVKQLILDTKTHEPSGELSKILIDADLAIFDESFDKLIEYEQKVFKEFQFVDFKIYREKRVEILQHYNHNGRLDALISYVKHHHPKIALFAGSFNPFHKGHFNVLRKAEVIFDKVIIAFGKNPDKPERHWPVPKTLQFHQMEEYTGLLTDLVSSFGYDITVVRGLRNSTDFQYEQNQYRYIQELMPDIKIVNIFCDKEFEHISSSGIRTLEKYNKHHQYILE